MPTDDPTSPQSAGVAELALEVEGLRTAMRSRAPIEQAKGALMALHGCDADAAFAILVHESQTRNVKLHQVAREFLVGLTEER